MVSFRVMAALLVLAVVTGCGTVPTNDAAPPGTKSPNGEETGLPATLAPTATISLARQAAQGRRLAEVHACLGCHTIDGKDRVGPSWKGLYGSTVELAEGTVISVDAEYLQESIKAPRAKLVKGYLPNSMPAYDLSEAEISAIIEFIKSLD